MKQFLFFSLLFITTITNAQINLIKNGGFENELINWRGEEMASLSSYIKKTGKNSAMINQFVGAEWKALDQTIYIPKNTYAVECSVWMKSDGIEEQKENYKSGEMIAEFTNSSDKQLFSEPVTQIKGTTDWVNYKKTFKITADVKKLRIMLALAQTNGTVFFDDVQVIALTEEEYFKLNPIITVAEGQKIKQFSNGNFEENLSSWNGFGLISTDSKEGNTAAEIISETAEWRSIDQLAEINDGDKTIEISGWLKAKNIIQGKDPWNTGLLFIKFEKDDTTQASEDQVIGTITGNTDWILFKKSFPIPKTATKYRIMIAMSVCTGTLLADDIQVKLSN
jgi:hypothetical protein